MLTFGIIGAENSHCAAIAKLCNVDKKLNARVGCVWGESKKYAKAAAESSDIPTIVSDWREMLGQVDGVMIDHRHAKHHYDPARFFIENKVPTFVDKPFTFTLREGKALCRLAKQKKTAVTSFSVIPQEQAFQAFKKQCKKAGTIVNLSTAGPVDLKSKYGGVFFYGIHQVDAIVEMLGTDADRVHVQPNAKGGAAIITFKSGATATMQMVNNGNWHFTFTATVDTEVIHYQHQRDDALYLGGAKTFTKMFRTGKMPFSNDRLLAPVAILEAMAKSIKQRKPVKVASLAL